ncbi:hypothetical protein CCAX7_000410 [Capsulimonas corticalis]|uniref:Uncharacterized protein n=1 Tax=Capsulimonas corticalis TaxID=2219043 RepID=A0A402CRF6_9BACT|nr:hypothetical protein [Capsulimonas corticalis]BDI27990.1 hypothetical protein CCAX7_000410 [Capsulimonas corticalis]
MSVEGADTVIGNLAKWIEERQKLAELAMNEVMAALEGWAKSEHAYTDRTANTTNSIRGEVAEATAEIVRGVLSAGMDYDIFLELAHDGKWAFLWPVIIRHEQDILNILRSRLGNDAVGASLSRSGSLAKSFADAKTNFRNDRARAAAHGAD